MTWLPFETVIDVGDYRDTDGRPLGEHQASQRTRDSVPTILKKCPYEGSRFEHANPMNVSALKQLTRHWDELLPGISFIRSHVLRRRGLDRMRSSADCLAVGEAVAALPAFVIHHHAHRCADGAVDPLVAALFKVIIGINRVYEVFVTEDLMSAGDADAAAPATAEDVAFIVEHGGFLIGSDEVCAGSARQIGEAIAALVDGTQPLPCPALERWMTPIADFLDFADGVSRINAATALCKTEVVLFLLRVGRGLEAADGAGASLRTTVEALIAELDFVGTIDRLTGARSQTQIEMIPQGLFKRAGGGSLERGRDAQAIELSGPVFAALPAPVRSELATGLTALADLQRHVARVVAVAEQDINRALGRSADGLSRDASTLLQRFHIPVIERVGAVLDIDLARQISSK